MKVQEERIIFTHEDNVFSILELTKKLSSRFNKNYDQIKNEIFENDTLRGAIQIFKKHFSNHITIINERTRMPIL